MIKICNKCEIAKPLDDFSNETRNVANHGKRYQCKVCDSAGNKAYRQNLNDEQRQKRYQNYKRHAVGNLKNKAIMMFNGIKQRVKKSKLPVTIERQFIHDALINGRCAATGFAFRYEKTKHDRGGITPFSPSIDRINSDHGYVDGNVQVVCSMYNVGKSHHDELDFIAMCLAVAERNANNADAWRRLVELKLVDVFPNER